jgi:hypothetical protein
VHPPHPPFAARAAPAGMSITTLVDEMAADRGAPRALHSRSSRSPVSTAKGP